MRLIFERDHSISFATSFTVRLGSVRSFRKSAPSSRWRPVGLLNLSQRLRSTFDRRLLRMYLREDCRTIYVLVWG
jgi:hypothetical protein